MLSVQKEGPTRNRTGVAGIRIRSDNRYTRKPQIRAEHGMNISEALT